jgi:hypothetical protein
MTDLATPHNPRYVTQADIQFYLRYTPGSTEDDGQKMLDAGIWRLASDPRLSGLFVDPILDASPAPAARGRC